MSRGRPINADVPVEPPAPPEAEAEAARPEEAAAASQETQRSPAPRPRAQEAGSAPGPKRARGAAPRRRRPVPGALKLIAALVAIAVGFIVLAIVGGGGGAGGDGASGDAAAPVLSPPVPPGSGGEDGGGGAEEEAASLGFPVGATNNTTRVGGADPASNAAAVALAVFPSTTPEQRPTAVSLVGEDDWAAGIAAAALVASPLRAPILIGGGDDPPTPTAEALAALAPSGGPASRGAAVFAIGVEPPGPGPSRAISRGGVSGAGPIASRAAAIAALRDRLLGPPAHIVIASASRPEFAMPAAGWAARSGDPVLFSGPERLPKATAAYLRKHAAVPVYVLGPSSSISSGVVREAEAAGGEVRRVAGEDPVANAIALARYSDGDFGWNVNDPGHGFVIARSDSPLDAAAAAPLSAAGTWGPLLLSDDAATLPAELRGYLLDVKPGYTDNPTRAFYNHVWVIGDQEAIDVQQQAEANELAELTRIGGDE